MAPQAIAPKEREIKETLKKDICTILSAIGYRLQDKDETFYPMLGYSPKFRLKYRVFLNNMPGFIGTKEKSPSFVVSVDGVLSVGQMVQNGMKGVNAPAKVKTPTKRVSGADRTLHESSPGRRKGSPSA